MLDNSFGSMYVKVIVLSTINEIDGIVIKKLALSSSSLQNGRSRLS